MIKRMKLLVLAVASGSVVTGCSSLKPKVDFDELPAPAAGPETEYIIDNVNPGFYTDGEWKESSVSSGYIGENYLAGEAGTGEKTATWNLNIIKRLDVYARWTSHGNRGSNIKYTVHHLNDQDFLTTTTIEVDQREFGGEWFKLGTFRMSTLTGRVTVSNDADGYVIADAVLFKEAAGVPSVDADNDGMLDAWEQEQGLDPIGPNIKLRTANLKSQYTVDQTAGGGEWQQLGAFTLGSGQLSVTLLNDADGYGDFQPSCPNNRV